MWSDMHYFWRLAQHLGLNDGVRRLLAGLQTECKLSVRKSDDRDKKVQETLLTHIHDVHQFRHQRCPHTMHSTFVSNGGLSCPSQFREIQLSRETSAALKD